MIKYNSREDWESKIEELADAVRIERKDVALSRLVTELKAYKEKYGRNYHLRLSRI